MNLRHLDDDVLFTRLEALIGQERLHLADVVSHIAEIDRRQLVQGRGHSNLFVYCVKKLGYSESAAYGRIRAARASLQFPRVLEDLRSGALHLDAIARLYPHLTEENCGMILDQAAGATKREVMKLAAAISPPEPAVERDVVKFLPPSAPPAGLPAAEVIPPASRIRLAFTADDEFLSMVEKLKQLRKHAFPEGRLEDVLKEAVASRLEALDPARPRRRRETSGRRIPAWIKAEVWRRDGGCCSFEADDGMRCRSVDRIEYDHVKPWALGGPSTVENVRLLCRAHNQWAAKKVFGPRKDCVRTQSRVPSP